MNITIYIDLYFLWNFVMDYGILTVLVWFRKQKASRKRRLLGAFIGSTVSVLLLVCVQNVHIFYLILCYISTAAILLLTTFGRCSKKLFVKNYLFFLLAANCAAGIMMSLGITSAFSMSDLLKGGGKPRNAGEKPIYLFFYAASYLIPVCIFLWYKTVSPEKESSLYEVVLKYRGKEWHGTGFLDTGNLLVNPTDGKPVVLLEKRYFEEMIGEGFSASEETVLALPDLCVIPFQSAGEPNGIFYGVRITDISLLQAGELWNSCGVIAAYCENLIPKGKAYQLLLNPKLLHD